MDVIFLELLNRSIAAGWLILAVMILRLLFKKAPRWMSCLLWGLVAVRLICPFSVESIFSLIPSAEIISQDTVSYSPNPAIDSGIPAVNNAVNPLISQSLTPSVGDSVNPLQVWMFGVSCLWAAGLFVMLGYALFSFLRLHRQVQEAVPLRENIWIGDTVASPFILGIIRPRIYLPSHMDAPQTEYVLAHEQAHLKRRDHWWKPLGYLLLSLYWFHPLCWAAYILLCRDIELACDEKVIRHMNLEEKKSYSRTLLSLSLQRKQILACPLAFGEVGVKERVKTVLHYKKPAFWVLVIAVAACIIAAVCFLTNPPSTAPRDIHFYSDSRIVSVSISQMTPGTAGAESSFQALEVRDEAWIADLRGELENLLMVSSKQSIQDYPQTDGAVTTISLQHEDGQYTTLFTYTEKGSVYIEQPYQGVFFATERFNTLLSSAAAQDTEPEDSVTLPSSLEEAIQKAITERRPLFYADFVMLAQENNSAADQAEPETVTCYGWVLHELYHVSDAGIQSTGGSHIPAALTFAVTEKGYELKEYWEPRDGSYYAPDIKAKFPSYLGDAAIDSLASIYPQKMNCYAQVISERGIDPFPVIEALLDKICSPLLPASDIATYIDKNSLDYRELLYYGEFTLAYREEYGDETEGLKQAVLNQACEEIEEIMQTGYYRKTEAPAGEP